MKRPPHAMPASDAGRQSRRRGIVRALGPLLGLAFVWTLFALLRTGDFVTWENQRIMLIQTAVVGTAAIGATLIIVSGGIDLSVGSSIALGTMVVALVLDSGATPSVAALAGIGTGALTGLVIGGMVVGYAGRVGAGIAGAVVAVLLWGRVGPIWAIGSGIGAAAVALVLGELFLRRLALPSFIVTLGMWGALRGLAKGIGDNSPIYPADIGWLGSLMQPGESGFGSVLPWGVWICLALAIAMTVVMRATPFGVHAYAIGSNERAARACGVRLERTKVLIYVLGVACAGLAGVLQFSFLTIGDPTTAQGYELRVIAAVVIGGASLSGGEGAVRGTLIGALIMTVVDNGCTKCGLENWVQEIVTGGIILIAVAIDQLRKRADE